MRKGSYLPAAMIECSMMRTSMIEMFVWSWISFCRVLQFYEYTSLITSSGKFVLRYFILLDGTVSGIVPIMSLSVCYDCIENAIDFSAY